jgi:O-antigen/teichoic acid export membrane protein
LIKSILRLGTANFLAQLLPFLITPLITRLYAPESFGSFSIFLSIVAISSVMASARYELAIVIVGKEKLKDILAINLILSLIFSVSIYFLLSYLSSKYSFFSNLDELLLAPVAIFFTTLTNSLIYLLTRYEKFSHLGKSAIIRSITFCLLQLSLFYVVSQSLSLILSWLVATIVMFVCMFVYAFKILKNDVHFKLNFVSMIETGKEFINFPKYSMPASLVSSCNSQFNIIVIPLIFTKEVLGNYALIERLLAAPISIIGNAIGQVYYSNIAKKDIEEVFEAFKEISIKIFMLSSLLYLLFKYILTRYFVVFFGSDWEYSVVLIDIFAFQFCVQLLVSPLLMTLQRYRLNQVELVFQITVLMCYFSSYYFFGQRNLEMQTLFSIVSKSVSFCYICMYFYIYIFLRKSVLNLSSSKLKNND